MVEAPHIELRHVARQWRGKGGVREVSLSVAKGTFVSLLGPSGCGKSTTLRLMAGLESPDHGTIHINGRDVTTTQPAERQLSMVFQSYALFPHLSVRDNILFVMKVRRAPRAEQRKGLEQAISMMGLEGLEDRKPSALSGGQRQRVALARSIVSGHSLFLMDEPLSNLDAKLRHAVRRDIKALQRRLGLTVVYVTHDQSEAMSLSDQIVLMRDGVIEQMGSPQDLYTKPRTRFVGEFIGDPPMAIIDGPALSAPIGTHIGIRPEAITAVELGNADIIGRVVEREYLGAMTQVIIQHPNASGLICRLTSAKLPIPGSEIGLSLPKEHRVLFEDGLNRPEKDPQQNYGALGRQTLPRDGRKASSSTKQIEEEPL